MDEIRCGRCGTFERDHAQAKCVGYIQVFIVLVRRSGAIGEFTWYKTNATSHEAAWALIEGWEAKAVTTQLWVVGIFTDLTRLPALPNITSKESS